MVSLLTQGPSAVQTIPVSQGAKLGDKKHHEERDRIGQGRESALNCFVNDEGEDYADVAEAIATVLEAYAAERGHSAIRKELLAYREQLETEREASADLKKAYQHEINLLNDVLETLEKENKLGLLEEVL